MVYTRDSRRKAETKAIDLKKEKSKSLNDKENMIDQQNKVSDMIQTAKSEHYQSSIAKTGKDSKNIFHFI